MPANYTYMPNKRKQKITSVYKNKKNRPIWAVWSFVVSIVVFAPRHHGAV